MRPLLIEVRDNAFVGLACQHHFHNLHRLGIGDAQTADKLRLFAHALHGLADFRPAAMHDNRVDADITHQHNVLHHGGFERLIQHRRAAILHHNRLARVLLYVRQGLNENFRLCHHYFPRKKVADRPQRGSRAVGLTYGESYAASRVEDAAIRPSRASSRHTGFAESGRKQTVRIQSHTLGEEIGVRSLSAKADIGR